MALSKALGCPVCEISAINGTGLAELKDILKKLLASPQIPKTSFKYSEDISLALDEIKALLPEEKAKAERESFYAVKLLSEDKTINKDFDKDILDRARELKVSLEEKYDDDIDSIITEQRYNWIRLTMHSVILKRREKS